MSSSTPTGTQPRRDSPTNTPIPAAPPLPEVAPDGSPGALRLPGGITVGRDTLLTIVPILLALIALWIAFDVFTNGGFTTSRNISDMFQEYSYKPVLALGVVFVLLLGEIDLSLGYLTLLSITIAAQFLQFLHTSALVAIVAALALCTLAGLAQGFFIAFVRMPAFVVTLGGFLIFEGVSLFILAGSSIPISDSTIQSIGSSYLPSGAGLALAVAIAVVFTLYQVSRRRARTRSGLPVQSWPVFAAQPLGVLVLLLALVFFLNSYQGVPLPLVILSVLAALLWFMARRTPYGRHIYAVGGNREASRRAGINTMMIRWTVFGLSGLMAGAAGIMLAGYGHTASPNAAGPDLLLDVISIAVIGGVSLTGGRGSVWSVLLGGLVIGSVDSGLNLLGAVDPSVIYMVKGGILLLAILIDVVGKSRGSLAIRA